MKILSLSNKMPYPPKDGGTIGIYSIVDSLADAGNYVSVLAINTPKHFINENEIPQIVKEKLNLNIVYVNTNINLFKLLYNFFFSKSPYIAERFYSKQYEQKLIHLLTENNFDVVQIEGLYMCNYISTIRKHSSAIISFRAHNIEHEIWERTAMNCKNFFEKIYLKNMTKRILDLKMKFLNKYDVLIPVTKRDGDIFNAIGNEKPVFVLPAGINYDNVKNNYNTEFHQNIFHLGALDWVPNQEGILWFIENCFPILKKNHPELKFHIAGRNAPASFIKKINVDDIVYHGEVKDAFDFMTSHGIMVVPLLSGSGMRIKIIEGMAIGKVIVSTPIGTEGIDTTHQENILIADNEFSFAKEIEKALTNIELYNKISKNAIQFIKNQYDKKNIGQNLTNFYKEQCKC